MRKISNESVLRTVILACLMTICLVAVSGSLSFAVERPDQVTKVKVVSNEVGKAVMTWVRVDCDGGYDIKYSPDKKMKKNVKVLNGRPGSHKKTIKDLRPGKAYYFRIRAYRLSKLKTSRIHGKWSKRIKCVVHIHKYKRYTIKALVKGVKQFKFKCSCGDAYYRAKANSGRKYEGIVVRLPSCITGLVKATPDSSIKHIPASKSHQLRITDDGTVCKRCGQTLNYVEHEVEDQDTGKEKKVKFYAPKNTFIDTSIALTVKNIKGKFYNYKLYYQKSDGNYMKYPEYKDYIEMHGCSTCVLTSVLNATVPKYKNYTPDRVIEEVIRPAVGEETFEANFSKSLKKQMPIGLKGISKVLKKAGVRHKYVYKYTHTSAKRDIKAHLRSGNPVIFYMSKSTLTPNTHAMVMLGLDKNDRVITGDTVHRSASQWGKNNRLVKFNTIKDAKSTKVSKLVRFFNSSTSSLDKVADFYNGPKGNIAYILVYKD